MFWGRIHENLLKKEVKVNIEKFRSTILEKFSNINVFGNIKYSYLFS